MTTIKDRARNKAFSKIQSKQRHLRQLEYDIERENTGAVTLHELEICFDVAKLELNTWNYIMKLIELDYEA